MPKKGNKVKTGGKGKKGKGKKGAKAPKDNHDEVIKQAIANAFVLESRLGATEVTKNEYKESTKTLLRENEKLQIQVVETEKDTVDVIGFLRDEDIKKNNQINKLQQMIKDLKKDHQKEKQDLIKEYTEDIQRLQLSLNEKCNEVKLMQSELKLVKEFRRKRAQMQQEIDDIRDNLHVNDKQHSQTLEKMERKFFDEKIRMQEEATRKISELAERAHSEAVSNLDETTRSIYKENVRLNESLQYHVTAGDALTEKNKILELENKKYSEEKETNGLIVEDKVIRTKKMEKQIKELQNKVIELEQVLTMSIEQNNRDKSSMIQEHQREQGDNKMEIIRLMRAIELKTKEMNRVKKLAKNILDQRSQVEKFFLDSLDIVRREISKNRSQYRRDAEAAYHKRMIEAHAGRAEYPMIRTFTDSKFSTNSVYLDLKAAERWSGMDSATDISDLTWEQRERVLRLLFASINGHKSKPFPLSKPKSLPPIKGSNRQKLPSSIGHTPRPPSSPQQKAFLTETAEKEVNVIGNGVEPSSAVMS